MFALLLFIAMAVNVAHAAPAPAGTVITTQATAQYIPSNYALVETVYSEPVTVIVSSVEALSLSPTNQTVSTTPNAPVLLSHVLSNVGNALSNYTFSLESNGSGCASTTYDLSSIKLVRDMNANGVVDSSDVVLSLNTAGAVSLTMGQSVSLLVEGLAPAQSSGTACLVLKATTQSQGVSASSIDTITMTSGAVLAVYKTASYTGSVQPGGSVAFTITANNIGLSDAAPTNVSSTASPILVNGVQTSLVLIRDVIPTGMTYSVGSLTTAIPNAIRLFRLPGDPLYSYRTQAQEDATAIEVAIGLPSGIVPNSSASMTFNALVNPSASGYISNIADTLYNDGTMVVSTPSNTSLIPVSGAKIGLAKAASQLRQ